MTSPRYLVGIDLGTTHTVVAYTPISDNLESSPIQIFEIDQLIAPGEVARKPLLPSFRYHPAEGEIDPALMVLPWDIEPVAGDIQHAIIGELAREMGAKVEADKSSVPKAGYRTPALTEPRPSFLGRPMQVSKKSLLLSQVQAT